MSACITVTFLPSFVQNNNTPCNQVMRHSLASSRSDWVRWVDLCTRLSLYFRPCLGLAHRWSSLALSLCHSVSVSRSFLADLLPRFHTPPLTPTLISLRHPHRHPQPSHLSQLNIQLTPYPPNTTPSIPFDPIRLHPHLRSTPSVWKSAFCITGTSHCNTHLLAPPPLDSYCSSPSIKASKPEYDGYLID